ncbi:hypothetical protein [uncultured Desulfovibrio sp.]|uniref:hypothetical protein n=1 Tax=uncultured Desulfovibrio sp. TaxID=167968 RepID=UPI002711E329|nr:hypothetical protein [uncultured Desulfovibrio sp.]
MKERPILMNRSMVNAILCGQKTQTRRPVKPQPDRAPASVSPLQMFDDARWRSWKCPFGEPGDRLWGRETFALGEPPYFGVAYRADEGDNPEDVGGKRQKWTPSIHMPRYLSRITLEITDVRAERVQDITEEEAIKEGVVDPIMGTYGLSPKTVFRDLWNDIYAKRGLGWEANPWVWVVIFKRVEDESLPGQWAGPIPMPEE